MPTFPSSQLSTRAPVYRIDVCQLTIPSSIHRQLSLLGTYLAVALAAERHSTPVTRATWVASSLQMGALNHFDTVFGGVLDEVRDWGRAAAIEFARSGAGEGQEADEGDGEGDELHSC
jgi:hypothetical protein